MVPQHLIVTVIAVVVLFEECAAIRCYYCNSANNSACLDVRQYEEYNLVPIVDCESSLPSTQPVPPFFCRKIMQTVMNMHGKEPELRVTRGCGWIPNSGDRDCYRADNQDRTETVCQCFTDGCNSAGSVGAGLLSVAGALLCWSLL